MTLDNLLGKGFFPKELPPPFHTSDLASKYDALKGNLNAVIGGEPTRSIDFSIAKVGLVRKMIKIPNPKYQCKLSEVIIENYTQIEDIFKASKFSVSRPKLVGERAANPEKFKVFVKKNFLASFPFLYELKTDISKYYPSIYTHSIPWAIHGKEVAKAKRKDKKLYGNVLDNFLQNTMYGQTIGIPIGPDTSLIIAEIIGCTIDKLLLDAIPCIVGHRYVDDMYFFFSNYSEAETALIKLQQILKEFELQVNTEKTMIRKIPRGVEPDWTMKLRTFEFRNTEIKQYNDIISFFSLAFNLALDLPNEYVLSYAVERVKRLPLLSDNNISLMETMLLKTMIAEPSTIKEIFRILFTYSDKISKNKIEKVLLDFIKYHCLRGNDYELSWALWMAKTFEIKLPESVTRLLSQTKDTISKLIILDLVDSKLINRTDLDSSEWLTLLELQSLKNENWLFAYEIGIKKWIGTSYNYIDNDPYFKILKNNHVSFYDPTRQINPIEVSTIGTEQSDQYNALTLGEELEVAETNKETQYEFQNEFDDSSGNSMYSGTDELDIDYLNYW
jgi:hypothetical protein